MHMVGRGGGFEELVNKNAVKHENRESPRLPHSLRSSRLSVHKKLTKTKPQGATGISTTLHPIEKTNNNFMH
jgi:hypothetical protein